MSKYNIGAEVINKDNPTEEGVIVKINPFKRGIQTYEVKYPNRREIELEQSLQEVIHANNPFELLKNGIYKSYLDFQQKNTSVKIRNTSTNTISSLKASKTIFQPYQYKPLLKFLNSDKKRLLIGDEVGVGKTIEAGHIMLELIGRQEMRNALIICPKSLIDKWRDELLNKFNLKFKIYHNKIDLISDLQANPSNIKGIINYEKFRLRQKNTGNNNSKAKNTLPDIPSFIEEKNINFDFVVCDEAHKLRNSTKTSRGIEKLLVNANGVVFLTATPIMTERRNLFNQLKLLDPETYFDYNIFENQDRINRPIVSALNQLNQHIPLPKIQKGLEEDKVLLKFGNQAFFEEHTSKTLFDFFKGDKLYQKVLHQLKNKEDSIENRVNIQHDLSSLNTLNTIFTRTRKKDVTTDWSNAVRKPYKLVAKLSHTETQRYNDTLNEYEKEKGEDNILGIIQVKRQISSSLYGYLGKSKHNHVALIEEHDSKYNLLKDLVNKIVKQKKKKLIVFATFKATLKYLQLRLYNDGFKSELISGDIPERNEVINKFRTNKSINILLSSEVGSEGIDMQFCNTIVNFDLPWNPMVVEQRIGRIHRFGQTSPVINIYTIVTSGSIEQDIYDRLLARIGVFRVSIGDLGPILVDSEGEDILKGLDKTLYSEKLNESQKREKIDDIARALEQRKIDINDIQSGLEDSITSDVYFDNEIKRINDNFKYVTEGELINFVYSILNSKLTTIKLQKDGEGFYKLSIPKSDKVVFINFLNENISDTSYYDIQSIHNSFISQIRESEEIFLTFNQQIAFDNKIANFINVYHPLILAIRNYYEKTVNKYYTFNFSLHNNEILEPGQYILAVYNLYIEKSSNIRKEKTKELLIPILYDLKHRTVIQDDKLSDKVLGLSQQFARHNDKVFKLSEDVIDQIQIDMPAYISDFKTKLKEEELIKMESQLQRRKKQEQSFFEFKIRQIENTIDSLESDNQTSTKEAQKKRSIIPALEQNIKNYEEQLESKTKYYDSFKVTVKSELLSISHINII